MKNLLLASGSPRRKELLEQVGIPFTVHKTDVDEESVRENQPDKLVEQLARLKGESVSIEENEVVLSADTVVSLNGDILTKPKNREEAFQMLSKLSGSKHTVYTGVMIRSLDKKKVFSAKTVVEFWDLSLEDIDAYINSGDPFDKAGGYGIQSNGAVLVKQIVGDYFTVVGLPIALVVQKLKQFDIYPSFKTK